MQRYHGPRPVPSPVRPAPQSSIVSADSKHALFLWITVHPSADPLAVGRLVARVQDHVDAVSPPQSGKKGDQILAGVGFGSQFYSRVTKMAAQETFHLLSRKHEDANLPSTGGDVFVHAKSESYSKLFELTQQIIGSLGKAVKKFEDVYGFEYMGGRDLSGFPYGLANAQSEMERRTVAVEGSTGGSYALTQRWEHDMPYIAAEKPDQLDSCVGRKRDDGEELHGKHVTAHIARMRGGNAFNMTPQVRIVRQSMPYGSLGSKAGLFFMAYSSSPKAYDYLLDRMSGYGRDGHVDLIFRMSHCVSGNVWYFPGVEELQRLARVQ